METWNGRSFISISSRFQFMSMPLLKFLLSVNHALNLGLDYQACCWHHSLSRSWRNNQRKAPEAAFDFRFYLGVSDFNQCPMFLSGNGSLGIFDMEPWTIDTFAPVTSGHSLDSRVDGENVNVTTSTVNIRKKSNLVASPRLIRISINPEVELIPTKPPSSLSCCCAPPPPYPRPHVPLTLYPRFGEWRALLKQLGRVGVRSSSPPSSSSRSRGGVG